MSLLSSRRARDKIGGSKHTKDKMVIANSHLGFIKRKSRLTNLGAFYNEKAGLVRNWRAVDFVYFNFSKAFDTVSHNIPIHKLMKYKLDKRGLKTGQIAGVKEL